MTRSSCIECKPDFHLSFSSTLPIIPIMDRFLLRTSIIERGAGLSPTGVAPWADSKQRIGCIKLRLEPPVHIQSWRDVVDIFMNHEFLRVVLAIAWIIVCGLIESFLAQLSDMRFADITFDKVIA